MKRNILLVDESLTVQKVVALTLDRQRYSVEVAKTRSEAMKAIMASPPDLILASDQVSSITASSFPQEVESWVGRDRDCPPIVLITSQQISEYGRYTSVLKKPFAPQALQALVMQLAPPDLLTPAVEPESEGRLQRIFQDSFSDEADLVRQTFQDEYEAEEKTSLNISNQKQATGGGQGKVETAAELWGVTDPKAHASHGMERGIEVMGAEDSMAYKAALESQLDRFLRSQNLEDLVMRALERMVPPIVEKVARERIDRLLKDEGELGDLKP